MLNALFIFVCWSVNTPGLLSSPSHYYLWNYRIMYNIPMELNLSKFTNCRKSGEKHHTPLNNLICNSKASYVCINNIIIIKVINSNLWYFHFKKMFLITKNSRPWTRNDKQLMWTIFWNFFCYMMCVDYIL